MAKTHEFEMVGHPSLYSETSRKLKVYFSEPEAGVNENTGILLLIAGFGGHANSNVYMKMRDTFADKYNLVTVQCDYFGWEFMQSANNISVDINRDLMEIKFKKSEVDYIYKDSHIFERLMEICSINKVNVKAKENIQENESNYNDMGLIQAMDNISAVMSVLEILKDNSYQINASKIILYGHSHGAYLSYLCNAFAPNLFSLLIDNSSWLFPEYIKKNRFLNTQYGNAILSVEFEYLAKKLNQDEEILYIPELYKKFENKCDIICYHGTTDNLISHHDKITLKKIIRKFQYNEINDDKLGNQIFKSTSHGLGADFLKLFEHTIGNYEFKQSNENEVEQNTIVYKTKKYNYTVSYDDIFPVLSIEDRI